MFEVREQPAEVDCLYHFSPKDKTGSKTWWQVPLPAEPSHQPKQEHFNSFFSISSLVLMEEEANGRPVVVWVPFIIQLFPLEA